MSVSVPRDRAIRPGEITAAKRLNTPPEVFQAFNELIVRHYSDGSAWFTQEAVVERILQILPGTYGVVSQRRAAIFDNHWLDVEDAYRAEGWEVTYSKPGYNEPGKATFTFRRPDPNAPRSWQ